MTTSAADDHDTATSSPSMPCDVSSMGITRDASRPPSCSLDAADDDAPLRDLDTGRRRRHLDRQRRRLRQRPAAPSARPPILSFLAAVVTMTTLTGNRAGSGGPSAFASASDAECPSSTNGWGASADCKSYFWCSDGTRSSITYECIQNTLYNVEIAQCVNAAGFECPGLAVTTTTTVATTVAGTPAAGSTVAATPAAVTTPAATLPAGGTGTTPAPSNPPYPGGPTAPPTKLGRPIYYGDFRTASCQSSLTFENAPDWIAEEDMFSSKEECCKTTFSWAPLENCLGPDFVEDNYVVGSRAPTLSPTHVPSSEPSASPTTSAVPSAAPTVTASGVPSGVPSEVPSGVPSEAPSSAPSTPPPTTTGPTVTQRPTATTEVPTASPTATTPGELLMQSSSSLSSSTENSYGSLPRPTSQQQQQQQQQQKDNFLVQLLGWTNSDLTVLDPPPPVEAEADVPPAEGMELQDADALAISTLTLPVLEDATISKQRTHDNFGTNSALAVSAGSISSEGFDSLLKFDVGIVDSSRVIDAAALHIRSVADCSQGGTFTTTTSSSWESRSVTWENAPGNDGYIIGTLQEVLQNEWYELDVLPALQWNDALSGFTSGTYLSIRITTADDKRCMFASKESGEGTAPYLTVIYRNEEPQEYVVPAAAAATANTGGLVSNLSSGGSDATSMGTMSIEPIAPGQFLLLRATDDATIDPKSPTAGSSTIDPLLLKNAFDISNFLVLDFLLRFDLAEMKNTRPRTAVLTLYAESTCTSAGKFVTTAGGSSVPDGGDWSDDAVSWSNAPAHDPALGAVGGTEIGTFGEVFAGNWYGFDVVRAVADAIDAGKTSLTFRVSSGNSGVCEFSSRRSGRDPKLMVAF
ncbi:hypothetical protein ACHAXS_007499 [Conticribra weissflogii]